MTTFVSLGYLGLFIASFLAATVVPFSSEVVFSALIFGGLDTWTCVFVATAGNWLGGLSCYFVGKLGKIEWIEKYLRIKKEKIEKWLEKIHHYGDWFAFFSFLPGIGDAIAVASGFFRCNFWIVAISMLLGKFVRYVVWMYFHGLIF
ncbi:Inner membrane protein YqaA [bioreactor metagenome]|uniref:Inner membrane protein YqaA n=1 Tax=bioreactor metagenome TaxID=1076179 RepID=A0A645D6K8_9ZZZZ|nr:YqaA family protein [Paludibacter sp.]